MPVRDIAKITAKLPKYFEIVVEIFNKNTLGDEEVIKTYFIRDESSINTLMKYKGNKGGTIRLDNAKLIANNFDYKEIRSIDLIKAIMLYE